MPCRRPTRGIAVDCWRATCNKPVSTPCRVSWTRMDEWQALLDSQIPAADDAQCRLYFQRGASCGGSPCQPAAPVRPPVVRQTLHAADVSGYLPESHAVGLAAGGDFWS